MQRMLIALLAITLCTEFSNAGSKEDDFRAVFQKYAREAHKELSKTVRDQGFLCPKIIDFEQIGQKPEGYVWKINCLSDTNEHWNLRYTLRPNGTELVEKW